MAGLPMQWTQSEDAFSLRLTDDEIVSRIAVMRKQEEGAYRCADYFAQIASLGSDEGSNCDYIDEDCRNKMSVWCYQVIDHCKINRETVSIAISFLDRFLLTKQGAKTLRDRKCFQLAAMTALYMSLKLFEDVIVEPKIMRSLSRGGYTESEFTNMEMQMLTALEWRVHPPTTVAFIAHFLHLLPPAVIDMKTRSQVFDYSKYQAELAVNDCYFVGMKPSTVAFAAIFNSMDLLSPSNMCRPVGSFLRKLEDITSTPLRSQMFFEAKERLMEASVDNCGYATHHTSFSPQEESELKHGQSFGELSPKCASFGM